MVQKWSLVLLMCLSFTNFAYGKNTPVTSGYVLTHEHPTYGMAFGGNYAFAGAEGNYIDGIMEKGYTAHCGGCKVIGKCDHGAVKGALIKYFGGLGKDIGVHESYMGPVHNSNSHLRYSTEWVKEAFSPSEDAYKDTNLKIMVALAVENEAMCEQLYYANKGNGGAGGNGYPCSKGDSFNSLKRQLDSLKAWVNRNRSWMQIAYSAKQLRQIVNSNKLAIILGIESEYAFGAEDRKFDPVTRLNRYYDMGVRTFYLAHKINSRLSGADVYLPKKNLAGRALRVTQAISGCFYYDDNVGQFPLAGTSNNYLCDNKCGNNAFKGGGPLGGALNQCSFKFSDISEANMTSYILTQGATTFNGFNIYPKPPGFTGYQFPGLPPSHWRGTRMDGDVERNNLGLSHDGERVVREAMTKGMIVNLDHISSLSREQIYELATKEFGNYPLNALHNKPNHMLSNKTNFKRHEYDFDDHELEFVRRTGGFFGLRMGPTDAIDSGKEASGITINCPRTSTETAKMLAYVLKKGLSVGYALDYATVTEGVHSRTKYSCGLQGNGDDELHMYEGHLAEGLSHIGLMKKWHAELKAIGLKETYLDKLKNDGVEQFIQMWENSEARAHIGKQISRQTFASEVTNVDKCTEDSNCSNDEYCAFTGADPRKNICKAKKEKGKLCTDKRQCLSGRCSVGRCAAADECTKDSQCSSGQYCGDPVAGARTCKDLKSLGAGCTKSSQCSSGRCAKGFCAAANECTKDSECASSQYCGDPISGRRTCKSLKSHGSGCTKSSQCESGRCAKGFCGDPDQCNSNADCTEHQYCGDPLSGIRKCKDLKRRGQLCTKGMQCESDKCFIGRCK